jgi:hypothetical protein
MHIGEIQIRFLTSSSRSRIGSNSLGIWVPSLYDNRAEGGKQTQQNSQTYCDIQWY